MDHVTNLFDDMTDCTDDIREILKAYPMLHYVINLMKCFILYKLGTDISADAAYVESLLFVTAFFLTTFSFPRSIRVVLAQGFWMVMAQTLRYHFLSNALMAMAMVLNEDIESVTNSMLATHVFQLIFHFGHEDQDLLCIKVTAVFVLIWYAACCSKSRFDLAFASLIGISYYAFLRKLTVASTGIGKAIRPIYMTSIKWLVSFCWFLLAYLSRVSD